ncbi:GNAT family N-acetyltransferase [Halomonas marinisediminis]|uniref:GNAT family N-acetyltransferase n=1 Tax=Halomonas marinisediminis TaxID=2546095 RepID=A0ABY2D4M7_9GAMM|nr:GNAT family N-acetyltransferase [Halomonas marinisediminis]TDB01423.1 GNAT family N-acetyltransferase [Halomonas marinisediminis]
MEKLEIRALTRAEARTAAGLLGRGMRDNPTHIRAFGADPVRRERTLRRIFVPFLQRQLGEGRVLGAFAGQRLVGVAALAAPGGCQPTLADRGRALPALLANGPASALRMRAWVRVWARRDAGMPRHWHLGPLAVAPEWQGQGVGSRLLSRLCDYLDRQRDLGYLETDLPENVRLYRRFGFETLASEPVIGVTHWFMQRQPDG